MRALNVWMNGELVGEWTSLRTGTPVFRYARSWNESPHARALSLSLPWSAGAELRGAIVDHYFDNLLPDSADIRRRLRDRFALRSMEPFTLLEAIGRDCVGAVQLLPPDEAPAGWDRIDAEPLATADVERLLRDVAVPPRFGTTTPDDFFRVSIAGAQEKTALLSMASRWFRPRRATPTTHILKLPLGIIGNFRRDFSDSVENEWLCLQVLAEIGLPVADARISRFGEQRALVVSRFDRLWVGVDAAAAARPRFKPAAGAWIARLPQEDFCQATGRPPSKRYESDGGPSIAEILDSLALGATPGPDRAHFVMAQFAFWLLAATDGHGKNFSIRHEVGGRYSMTPIYDVLSAFPVIGRGANKLSLQDARLAMALAGKRRHYKLGEIQPRHWRALAERVGGAGLWERLIAMAASVGNAFEGVGSRLPPDFPSAVFESIASGARAQARRFREGIVAT